MNTKQKIINDILNFLKNKFGVLERNIEMIIGYKNKEDSKINYLVLLGSIKNNDQWTSYSFNSLKSGEKVLAIGNITLIKQIEKLNPFIIKPLEIGWPIFNEYCFQELKIKISLIKKNMALA